MLFYDKLNLQGIIDLEKDVRSFSRKTWSDKYFPIFCEDYEFDTCIKLEHVKCIIVFRNLFKDPTDYYTPAMQIYRHWLLGVTLEGNSNLSLGRLKEADDFRSEKSTEANDENKLSKEEVNLFFNGEEKELIEFRKKINELFPIPDFILDSKAKEINQKTENKPSLDWKLLYFPAKHLISSDKVEEIKGKFLSINNTENYELMLVYGIVSQTSHLMSDKKRILDIAKNFLARKNFDVLKELEVKDATRRSEPIMLWFSKGKYLDSDFIPILGVNFGYDNGLSGYRLGLGIYLADANVKFYNFTKKEFKIFDNTIDVGHDFDSWIHHKTYKDIETRFEIFLADGFHKIFLNIKRMIESAKSSLYKDPESSKRLLLNYHRTDFSNHASDLSKFHDDFCPKYGANHYTHFLCWASLAEQIQHNNYLFRTANLIARNMLILKKKW